LSIGHSTESLGGSILCDVSLLFLCLFINSIALITLDLCNSLLLLLLLMFLDQRGFFFRKRQRDWSRLVGKDVFQHINGDIVSVKHAVDAKFPLIETN
jgi:hypothetical protein